MIEKTIIKLIKETFNLSTTNINTKTIPYDVDEWDSLGHIMLIQAIEENFNLSFELEELLEFESVQHIIDAVDNKINNGI